MTGTRLSTGESDPRRWNGRRWWVAGRLPWHRLGLRMRLTVLYGGLFFVAGSVLLWFTYLLTARALNQRFRLVIASA